VEAWFHLGVLHLRGWGTPTSPTQALYYFSLAAKMGHLLAQYNLAMMHLSGSAAEKCAALRLCHKRNAIRAASHKAPSFAAAEAFGLSAVHLLAAYMVPSCIRKASRSRSVARGVHKFSKVLKVTVTLNSPNGEVRCCEA